MQVQLELHRPETNVGHIEYVRLGSSGLKVSRVALGMMSFGDPELRPWSLKLEDSDSRVVDAGATRAGHVDDAVASVSLRLDPDERKRLETPYKPHGISGHA